jgi:hypothetical protein
MSIGEVKADTVAAVVAENEVLHDTSVFNTTGPEKAVIWYDSSVITAAMNYARIVNVKLGGVKRSMISTSASLGYQIDVSAYVSDPNKILSEEARKNLIEVSSHDLLGVAAGTNPHQEEIITYTKVPSPCSPTEMTKLPNWVTSLWWLEYYANIALGVADNVPQDISDNASRDETKRVRKRTAWMLSEASTQSLALEYSILRTLEPFVKFREGDVLPWSHVASMRAAEVMDSVPMVTWLKEAVGEMIAPFGAKAAGTTVQVVPLPSCLALPMYDEEQLLKPVDGKLTVIESGLPVDFWRLLARPYKRWVEDFTNRVTFETRLYGLWTSLYPGSTAPGTLSRKMGGEAMNNYFTRPTVVSSDGVYADKNVDVYGDLYSVHIDGYQRSAKVDDPVLIGELPQSRVAYYTSPTTDLHRAYSEDPLKPSMLRAQRPDNMYTPYIEVTYTADTFIKAAGGLPAALFPNTYVTLADGTRRPPEDGDRLYGSAYWVILTHGRPYQIPSIVVDDMYVLGSNGIRCVLSLEYLRRLYWAGELTPAQTEFRLFDQSLVSRVDEWSDFVEDATELDVIANSWPRIVVWTSGTSGSTLVTVQHFSAIRPTV